MKRRCEEMRRDYEKRKEHIKDEGLRRSKTLAEDNKQLQRCGHGDRCYGNQYSMQGAGC